MSSTIGNSVFFFLRLEGSKTDCFHWEETLSALLYIQKPNEEKRKKKKKKRLYLFLVDTTNAPLSKCIFGVFLLHHFLIFCLSIK